MQHKQCILGKEKKPPTATISRIGRLIKENITFQVSHREVSLHCLEDRGELRARMCAHTHTHTHTQTLLSSGLVVWGCCPDDSGVLGPTERRGGGTEQQGGWGGAISLEVVTFLTDMLHHQEPSYHPPTTHKPKPHQPPPG